MRSLLQAFVLIVAAVGVSPAANAGTVLISAEEAKLPPPKGAIAVASRGITRGPKIAYVSTADPTRSPMRLQLKFESFGGSKIDTDSLKVTYVKTPAVDLTPRLKPFVQSTASICLMPNCLRAIISFASM